MNRTSYKSQLILGLSALVFLLVPMVSWATPTLVPSGLSAGDIYRLVFVTSTTRDATSTDITDYDAHVQDAADNATISIGVGSAIGDIDWLAIGTTDTVDAIDHINVGTAPVYRLDGTKVAVNETDLFDGSILASININENEQTLTAFVWTGSNTDGRAAGTSFELGDSSTIESLTGIAAGVLTEKKRPFQQNINSQSSLYLGSAKPWWLRFQSPRRLRCLGPDCSG